MIGYRGKHNIPVFVRDHNDCVIVVESSDTVIKTKSQSEEHAIKEIKRLMRSGVKHYSAYSEYHTDGRSNVEYFIDDLSV